MAVFKRLSCRDCGKVKEVSRELKKAPPCEDCGGETYYSEKWYVAAIVLGEGGRKKKIRKAVHKNKQRAIEYEAKLINDRTEGELYERATSILFDRAAEIFIDFCRDRVAEGNLSQKTLTFYEGQVNSALVPFFGGMDLKKITPDVCERFKRQRMSATRQVYVGEGKRRDVESGRQITPASVNRSLATLKRLFSVMKKKQVLRDNPMESVELLREDNKREEYLTDEQIDKLLENCKSPHLRLAVLVALETGMRKDGCLTLKWEDVDFKRGTVRKVVKGRKEVVIPMTNTLRDELLALRASQKVTSFKGYVIPSPKKTDAPMRIDADFGFDTACRKAGIKGFLFHDLRHTFATHFLELTGDIHTLADILGHSTIYMTSRYAHIMDRKKREAMRVFEEGKK